MTVWSPQEGDCCAQGYILHEGLLVRKWLPHSRSFVGDLILQTVVPIRFWKLVLIKVNDYLPYYYLR